MITYIEGDIFKGGDDVIVHGCNCLCNFGAGIALQVLRIYPEAYRADRETGYKDANKLGTFSSWTGNNFYTHEKSVTVVNAYTQFYPNVKLKPFDYDAFERVLKKIKECFYDRTIAMPKIGAGLAGGDWNRISKIIEEVFPDKEIKIYIYVPLAD